MPVASRSRKSKKGSRRRSSGFWQPGAFFNWLTTGSTTGERGSRKKKKRGSRRSKKSTSYVTAPRAAVASRVRKTAKSHPSYRAFFKEHYNAARAHAQAAGHTGQDLNHAALKRVVHLWKEHKAGKGHSKKSTSYHRRKRSVSYCDGGSRRGGWKDSAAYSGSRKGSRHTHKHKHGKGIVCVCAVVGGKKKKEGEKSKESTSYKSRSRRSLKKWSSGIKLRKGTLSHYGYHASMSIPERREALARAVKHWGAGVVVKKLTVVGNLSANRSPTKAKTFHTDAHWVSKTYHLGKHSSR